MKKEEKRCGISFTIKRMGRWRKKKKVFNAIREKEKRIYIMSHCHNASNRSMKSPSEKCRSNRIITIIKIQNMRSNKIIIIIKIQNMQTPPNIEEEQNHIYIDFIQFQLREWLSYLSSGIVSINMFINV